ncbi:unnamed protein product [Brassica oleracea]
MHCSYCEWVDEEEVNGWQKKALLEARDETMRRRNRYVNELSLSIFFLLSSSNSSSKLNDSSSNTGKKHNEKLTMI